MREPKVVLVTGCSQGIGRDLAQRMTEAGYAVVATARRAETLEPLDAALKLQLDVTSDGSVGEAVERVLERFGRIDVLVNNAGFNECGAIEELPDEALRSMFEVNVFGVLRMMRAVLPAMRRQGTGRILNISSLAGRMSMPVNGGYSATKYALEAISDAARQELAPFGIRVILVQPGSIATRFSDSMNARSAKTIEDADSPYTVLYRRNRALQVTQRKGNPGPEEVSHVVLEALADDKPKARYRAGMPFLARMMSRLKAELRDYIWGEALRRADEV